jgi:hypothetical protein
MADRVEGSSLNLTMYLVGSLDSSNPVKEAYVDVGSVSATATAVVENKPLIVFVV